VERDGDGHARDEAHHHHCEGESSEEVHREAPFVDGGRAARTVKTARAATATAIPMSVNSQVPSRPSSSVIPPADVTSRLPPPSFAHVRVVAGRYARNRVGAALERRLRHAFLGWHWLPTGWADVDRVLPVRSPGHARILFRIRRL
jgi:hypothetical protein